MFRERAMGKPIYWTPDHRTKIEWNREISEITHGSSVGLKTEEGDFVRIRVTKNDAGDFTGFIFDIRPDPPRSRRIVNRGVDAEVRFGERNLIFVFSVPEQPVE